MSEILASTCNFEKIKTVRTMDLIPRYTSGHVIVDDISLRIESIYFKNRFCTRVVLILEIATQIARSSLLLRILELRVSA